MSKTASGVCCVIKTCRASKRKVPNLRLFKFPKNNEVQLREWLQACGIPDVSAMGTRKYLICHRHFSPDQLGEVYLKKNAVPQRYLDTPPPPPPPTSQNIKSTEANLDNNIKNSNSDTQENSSTCDDSDDNDNGKPSDDSHQFSNRKYRKSGRRCIIKSCHATYRCNPKLRFFSFPNPKSDRFQKWVEICKLTPIDLQLKNILICEKHFWKAELCGKRYTADAEPKFFLSAPRYKIIGPSDPNFKAQQQQQQQEDQLNNDDQNLIQKEKSFVNKCIIKTCGITSKNLVNMMTIPKEALNLFDVWSDIFKLDPAEVFNIDMNSIKENNNLCICKKHSLSQKEFIDDPFHEEVFPSTKIKNENLDIDLDIADTCNHSNGENTFCRPIQNSDNLKSIQKYYEDEISKLKKEAEKEKIKHLSIISNLKEENFKLKDEINRFK